VFVRGQFSKTGSNLRDFSFGGVRIPRRKKLSKMGGKRDKKCDEK